MIDNKVSMVLKNSTKATMGNSKHQSVPFFLHIITLMNKKILAKTLLPIATVALLGGGIASSIVLNSCSEGTNESIILTVNNYEEYLANHVVKCEEEYFTTNSDYEINLVDDFFVWLSHNYTKQVFVNGIIGTAFAGTILVPYATTVTVEIKSDSIIVVEKTETQTNIQKYVFEK
jgi:hypothetical protein